jgi:hypothetical protein
VPRKTKELLNEQAYWVDGNTSSSTDAYSLDKEVCH